MFFRFTISYLFEFIVVSCFGCYLVVLFSCDLILVVFVGFGFSYCGWAWIGFLASDLWLFCVGLVILWSLLVGCVWICL